MPVDIKNRTYRTMSAVMEPVVDEASEQPTYRVTGYATTWDDPYMLYESEYGKVFEKVDRNAIDADTDMSDVIMQYDHSGSVMARLSNGTLTIDTTDPHGLRVEADLSKSAAARNLYEEISNGLVTRMSWAFSVDRDVYESDREAKSSTRTIAHVKKVYDVSAVSIPANDATEISARSYFDGVIEAEQQELLQRRREREAAAARLRLTSLE